MRKFISIRWKMSGILILSNLIMGLVLIFFLSRTVSQSLHKELIERGRTIGLNLATNSGDLILENDNQGIKHLITNNMNFESLDYIIIYNDQGQILGDTFNGQIPKALTFSDFSAVSQSKSPHLLNIPEKNAECYDIWIPVEEGYIGFVRIGMDTNYVKKTVFSTIQLIIITILIVTLLGIFIVILLAGRLIRPITYLTKRADEISQGKLDEPVSIKTGDEIEQLSDALERLRESVKIALERLKRYQSIRM